MKNWKLFSFGLITSLVLNSCSTPYFYQLYTAEGNNIVTEGKNYVFEDQNCKITYNLWSEGGNPGFKFYNKTSQYIYLNLEESFFVLNGHANNYFQNRVFTSSSSKGATTAKAASSSSSIGATVKVEGMNAYGYRQENSAAITNYGTFYLASGTTYSKGYSVATHEEKIICIPPYTFKEIFEYAIATNLYRDCELFLYPDRNDNNKMTFTSATSPVIFSNRITYSLGKDGNQVLVSNDFFVKEIVNLPEKEVVTREYETYCGEKKTYTRKYFKQVRPNQFYIFYKKSGTIWKH